MIDHKIRWLGDHPVNERIMRELAEREGLEVSQAPLSGCSR
jgi:hypothetical protein